MEALPAGPAGASPEGRRRPVKALDALIVVAAAAATVALSAAVYGGPAPSRVVITSGSDEWIYPLSEDRVVAVGGLIGDSVIHIENGEARFEDSPCDNKTCVAAAPVRRSGEWSACLPNGVFLRAEGESGDDAVDATVR